MTWWLDPLRSVVAGRRLVLAGAVPAAWTPTVAAVRAAGAGDVLIVATEGPGAGAGPDVATYVAPTPAGGSTMERLRAGLALLREPPPELCGEIDRFDPGGEALVLATFLADVPSLHGRPVLAHRRPAWLALEDKTVVDALWDRAGVARQPALVVDVGHATERAPAIDRGAGTVWSGDAREGFNGGAAMVHWVVDPGDAERAQAALAPHCDRVRVMPFVEGIPCSVHGIVLPDGVVVLRPVEMVVLRQGRRLVYAGCATFWDPVPAVRRQMRAAARAVGEQLRAEVGFRGAFTVDGIAAEDGFWPTELNPRYGAGLNSVARSIGDVPLTLVNDLVVAGVDLGRDAAALERELLAAADADRAGGTWRPTADDTQRVLGRGVVAAARGLRWALEGEAPHLTVDTSPGFTRAVFAPAHTPVGPSVGPEACAFWAFADRELRTGIGPLTPPGA